MRPLITSVFLASLAFLGFEGREKMKPADFVPGTYGGSQVVLCVNKNGTYSYSDRTLKAPVELSGEWSRTGNVIVLKKTGGYKIHDHWKIDKGSTCLKARKDLEWRRLCLLKPE